jgi:hypothetical protein
MKTSSFAFQSIVLTAGLCLATSQLRAQTIAYDVPQGTLGNKQINTFTGLNAHVRFTSASCVQYHTRQMEVSL